MSEDDTTTKTKEAVVNHALLAKETNDMRFTLTEVPPWYLTILLVRARSHDVLLSRSLTALFC